MTNSVLVLGAGIAGMRAAAELVQQGFEVYLLEKKSRIDNNWESIDHLFPTDECAACSLQPLLLELFNNANAKILTSTELLSLRGQAGDLTAEVLKEKDEDKGGSKEVLSVGAVIVATGQEEDKGETHEHLGYGMQALAERLGLELDDKGNFKRDLENGHPLLTARKGVFVCGGGLGPIKIGESVVRACAAASQAASLLVPAKRNGLTKPEENHFFPVKAEDEPRIAVVIDQGDADVKDLLDLDELATYTQSLPGVEQVELTARASDGSSIKDLIGTGDFNRLIVAGPSPIPHEGLFQRHAAEADLNPYLLEMVNLHNQCARVHSSDRKQATEKAKTLMNMGVARVRQLEPLEELKFDITQSCLVIGGSISGVACAVRLAEMGINVHLVTSSPEQEKIRESDHPLIKPLPAKLSNSENVIVHTDAAVEDSQGCLGNFIVTLNQPGEPETLKVGAIVLASAMSIEKGGDGSPLEESLALEKDSDGFYKSTQGIMNLLDFTTEGVFNCGAARTALEIEVAVLDGEAAASRAACILSSPSITRSPVISLVVNENCDGCAYCIDPCPTRSLTLLEYVHRSAVKKVAEHNKVTCIGCGICMSTCPKKGIFVKHFRLETFSEMVKTALKASDFQPSIICFCCSRCAYPGADAAGSMGIQYPASVKIIRSVCSGMIHPNIVIDALTQDGADGVLLCGCHPGNCRSREGVLKAQARTEAIDLMLEDFALEPERFRLEFIAASEGKKFAKVIEEMTEELSALGPNPYNKT
jgi:heterodisulfide reductase subunit A-like polyferredoxin/coenzyme F420-reducing hydrogenase delta subunit